ncbi:20202_t:CDS:2, partial [Gigaspora rosea]
VKVCEFGSTTLNIEHISVDFENQFYKKIFDANEFSINTFTLNTYGQAYNTPCPYIDPITNNRCNGGPINNTSDISYSKFIGCQKYQFGQKGHRYIAISHRVNLEYFEKLIQNYTYCSDRISQKDYKSTNECFTVFSDSSTTNYCRILDDGQYLVLYTRKEQTELLSQALYAEIDMAFKRIHGITNEWEICAYIDRYQKTLVFARMFTNFQSAKAYQYLFEDLFDIVEKDTQKQFQFQHIHGYGLGCIIADEHQGQAFGFGQYLHSKYSHLSCEEHLKHINKLCQVHFNRNIRNKAVSDKTKELMYSVTKLDTQEQILNVLEKIRKSGEPEAAADWVKNKYKPWILAGLSP